MAKRWIEKKNDSGMNKEIMIGQMIGTQTPKKIAEAVAESIYKD